MKQLQDAVKQEDWNGALEIMEKLKPEQRKCLEGFYVLGMISLQCQQYEQAQGFFVSALEYKMDDPACLYQLAYRVPIGADGRSGRIYFPLRGSGGA